MAVLTDFKIDFETGEILLDTATNDGQIVEDIDVILQNLGLRLRTQLGTIKRIELDEFGWDFLKLLKSDLTLNDIITIGRKIEDVVLQDDNIESVEVTPGEFDSKTETLPFLIELKIDGEKFSLIFPFGSA